MLRGRVSSIGNDVSIPDSHHQKSVLGSIQREQDKPFFVEDGLEVEIKIRAKFGFGGFAVLFYGSEIQPVDAVALSL